MLPREKFSRWGIASLSLSELIAIIIGTGGRRKDVISVSKTIENLIKLGKLTRDALEEIDGVGGVKSMKLLCSMELGYRMSCSSAIKERIDSAKKAYSIFRKISEHKQEHLLAIFLNANLEMIGEKLLGIGTIDRLHILPRDIIISALELNGAYVILGHNHPSGSLVPSKEDILMTKDFKKILEIVGITLVDHLIISASGYKSIDLG